MSGFISETESTGKTTSSQTVMQDDYAQFFLSTRFKGYAKAEVIVPPFLEERIKSIVRGRVLDIGTGDGRKLKTLLNGRVDELVCIEPSAMRKIAINELDRYDPKIVSLTFERYRPDNRFDTILMLEVIEHLSDPAKAVAKVCRLLKPDGVAIFSTPNRFMYKILCGITPEKFDPTHINMFSPSEFFYLMKSFFKEVEIIGYLPTVMTLVRMNPRLDFMNKLVAGIPWISRTFYALCRRPK